jgi:hypothetical protein
MMPSQGCLKCFHTSNHGHASSHTDCDTLTIISLHLVGLPNDNDTIYCPHNQSSCYWQQGGSYTYQQAKDRCASLSGYVVSWNDASEQLQIENYFRVGALAGAWLQALPSSGIYGILNHSTATCTPMPS